MIVVGLSVLVIVLSVALVLSQRNAKAWENLYEERNEDYLEQVRKTGEAKALIQAHISDTWRDMYEEKNREIRSMSFPREKTNDVETGMQARVDFFQSKDGDTKDGDTNEI